MAKGRFVKKIVPATSTNKQKHIVNFLLSEGHSASRINTTGIYKEEIKQYIRGGGRVGHSDISGVFKSKYYFPLSQTQIGIAFYIEGKWTDGDTLSTEQKEFRAEVTAAGAFYLLCESVEAFNIWYERIKKDHL